MGLDWNFMGLGIYNGNSIGFNGLESDFNGDLRFNGI
jgi:hypothetical protein